MKNRFWRNLVLFMALLAPLPVLAAATSPVARTGQIISYAAGDTTAGVAWPDPRFVVNLQADGVTPDGTVTDKLTGLIWLRNANCTEAVGGVDKSNGYLTWADALTWSNSLASGDCGLNDGSTAGQWRLPNIKALWSMINFGEADSAAWLNSSTQGFSNVMIYPYWTSSTYVLDPTYAWNVGTTRGKLDYQPKLTASFYVWPVRGGYLGILGLSPASMDFGSVSVGATSLQTLTLTNNGLANLDIGGFSLVGGNSGAFGVDPGDGSSNGTCASRILAPQGSCTVSATFTPDSSGPKTTVLRITSADQYSPAKDITLSGSGAGPIYVISTTVVGGNGTISCVSSIASGGTSNCTISPTTGYHLATFTDNSVDKLSSVVANAYSITNVTAYHAVEGTFEIDSYSVTFDSNSGSGSMTSQSANYNVATALTSNSFTKTGYTFAGWNSAANGSGTAYADGVSYPFTASATLYAQWTINSYSVTFDSNSGSAVISQTVTSGSSATTPTAPVRAGFTFAGWYSDAPLTAAFAFTTPITADTTLYAKWTINSYSVTFDSNSGSAVSSQTVASGSTATSPPAPARAGYSFAGWYSDAALTAAFAFTTPITADTTLYAQWTVIVSTYTVAPAAGTGSSMTPSTPQTVVSGAAISFTVAPLAGYGILSVTGCNGTLSSNIYTTGTVAVNCTASATAVKRDGNSGTTADPSIADVQKAMQAYMGLLTLTPEERIIYDVAPLDANGIPMGNGVVDVADVIMVLRRVVGIGSW